MTQQAVPSPKRRLPVIERKELGVVFKKLATGIVTFAVAVTAVGYRRPGCEPAPAAAATPASAVAERGRKLAEAVERVFADIYSASEATRSGAGEAQLAQGERALMPYEKLAPITDSSL